MIIQKNVAKNYQPYTRISLRRTRAQRTPESHLRIISKLNYYHCASKWGRKGALWFL